jgi:protein SCO1/2
VRRPAALLLALLLAPGCHRRPPPHPFVPDFAYPDQEGQPVTRDSLRGHPWVADFIFTRCTSVCPVLSAQMLLLQRAVPADAARFVSFSIDPAHDSVAVLRDYAARWHVDARRWHLLATDARSLPALANALAVRVQANDDAADPILHSGRMILVGADGDVRGVYDSRDEQAMALLTTALRSLAGSAAPARAPDGAALFAELGCAACHDQATLAPPLRGLFGHAVALANGQQVTADAAYLRRALLDPTRELVAGYSPIMPSYADRLDEPALRALLAHLESLR